MYLYSIWILCTLFIAAVSSKEISKNKVAAVDTEAQATGEHFGHHHGHHYHKSPLVIEGHHEFHHHHKIPVPKPVPVPIIKEVPVPVVKHIPYPVIKHVPIYKHIHVPVAKHFSFSISKHFPFFKFHTGFVHHYQPPHYHDFGHQGYHFGHGQRGAYHGLH
ncbi:histidine-rich glycoprotein [Folsomia candida]|uniref:Histidine-rich glycoprotein n=1 Tax=Folsomia candida TaxID=158441 RepID=A0A226EWI6_FOLCA|nr:histidine-rich glycoprotein [Folsomia candida]OXA61538.1 hypothetical protein Fcan01_01884 [Folsomia candida]